MSDIDLCYLPAGEAVRLFKARKLSPVELMQATIARAESLREPINALTFTHFEEALELARRAEAKYAQWKPTRPLEGLPVGIKDESFLQVPSGRAKNGVPTGIQIVGPTYRDASVFRVGMAYEKACGEWFTDSRTRPTPNP